MKATTQTMQSVQNIVNNSASWRDALDKLQGYDLIFSVHCVKARFGVGDTDILAWINGVN